MKLRYYIALIVLFSAVVFATFGRSNTVSWTTNPTTSSEASSSPILQVEAPAAKIPQVIIRSTIIPIELAQTTAEVQKGLSGRKSLERDKGMLFIFQKPAMYQFWMPDMHFPIDIIWIHEGKIIDISANVSNNFDPAKPTFYSSRKPVNYVLEVNAGFAAQNEIKIGDTVTLQNIDI